MGILTMYSQLWLDNQRLLNFWVNNQFSQISGGKWGLRLSPELAYREKGARWPMWEPTFRFIPLNSTLLFDVEYVGRAFC
jgi:hypothetical protein